MKTYEKPKLMVLSISANDALCSDCETKTRGNDYLANVLGDTNGNNFFDREDADKLGLFADAADTCSVPYVGYCKFAHDNRLFTS